MFTPAQFAAVAATAGLLDTATHTPAGGGAGTTIRGQFDSDYADALGRIEAAGPVFRVSGDIAAGIQRGDALEITAALCGVLGTYSVRSKHPLAGDVLLQLSR